MPSQIEDPQPVGQPYGAKAEQQAFIEQTQSVAQDQEPEPVQQVQPLVQNVFEPSPEANVNFADEMLVQGRDLFPDEASVLFGEEPDRGELDVLDPDWSLVLEDIASTPGASEGMRALAAALRRR